MSPEPLTRTETDEGFETALQNQCRLYTTHEAKFGVSSNSLASRPMPSSNERKQLDALQAKEIGVRVKLILNNESVTASSKRLGISRQWLHDILSGRVTREASIATLSNISDTFGYSLEWLVTGKGMPNDRWGAKTTLVPRVAPKADARKKISLVRTDDDLVLMPTSLLRGVATDVTDLGVLAGKEIDLGPLIGPSDEALIDLKDHTLVKNALFIAQVEERLLACNTIKARSSWLLSSTESVTPESLIADYRIVGRIRLIWKRV